MSRPARVVLVGAYGIENAGDDAPLCVLADGLRRRLPGVELTVVARHPDPVMAETAGVAFVQNLEHESRAAAAGRRLRGFNTGDDEGPLRDVEELVRSADLVVAGAGNALIDLTLGLLRGPLALLATYAFLADLHRTPLMLYGISAGPLRTEQGRALAGWIARRSAVVTCRDADSARLLAELAPEVHARVLPDPVLGLAPASDAELAAFWRAEQIPPRGARPRLAVALRDLTSLGDHRATLIGALRLLAERFELLFVPQSTYREDDDRAEAERVAAALPGAVVRHVRNRHPPAVLLRVYESAAACLAVRLHGAVFAAMSGVPVVGFAYLPKVRGFFAELGREDLVAEPGIGAEELAARVIRAHQAGGAELRRRCAELAQRVEGYAETAAGLARKRRT